MVITRLMRGQYKYGLAAILSYIEFVDIMIEALCSASWGLAGLL
jgi:hypothetical protein